MSGKNEQREGFIEQNMQNEGAKEIVRTSKKVVSAVSAVSSTSDISKTLTSPFQTVSTVIDGTETVKNISKDDDTVKKE